MIVKSLPYNISVLVLNKISLRVFYVSIFLVIFMSFIDFVFSKIQNKKPFVKAHLQEGDKHVGLKYDADSGHRGVPVGHQDLV